MLDQNTNHPPFVYLGPERRKSPRLPSAQQQEHYWDWWQENRSLNAWASQRAETILTLLRSLNLDHPRILDSGCGSGWFTEMLANLGETTGIDLSKEHIRIAQERAPHIRFIGGSIFEHEFSKGYFDVVVSQQVIAHVEDQSRYVHETAEALRPRGYLILTTNNKFVLNRLGDERQSHAAYGHIENFLTMRQLQKLLAPHFDVLEKRSILPMGKRGILRVVNSHKLNRLFSAVVPTQYLEDMKGRAGLGYINVVLARKKIS